MRHVIRRCSVLTGVALCAVFIGGVGVAQASDNTLRATLNVYGPKIKQDEAAIKAGVKLYEQGKTKPVIKAITHEINDLHALNGKLRHESASTSRDKKAKAELVTGFGLVAAAYTELRSAIKAAHGGLVNATAAKAAATEAHKGQSLIKAGLKLFK